MTRESVSSNRLRTAVPQILAMTHLALLAAAWRWTKDEAAQIVGLTPELFDHYTSSVAPVPAEVADTIAALYRVHYQIWATRRFGDYAEWWRKPWRETSPIGARTPLDAILADGRPAIDLISAFYDEMLSGDFS